MSHHSRPLPVDVPSLSPQRDGGYNGSPQSSLSHSSLAHTTTSALQSNELAKLRQSMLQREAMGTIKNAGLSHGGADGAASEQIAFAQHQHPPSLASGVGLVRRQSSSSSLFRDPLGPALPADSADNSKFSASLGHSSPLLQRHHHVHPSLLLGGVDAASPAGSARQHGEPLHFDLTDRQSFRAAMSRMDDRRDGGDVERAASRSFVSGSGPERSGSANGAPQADRLLSTAGLPNRLSFTSVPLVDHRLGGAEDDRRSASRRSADDGGFNAEPQLQSDAHRRGSEASSTSGLGPFAVLHEAMPSTRSVRADLHDVQSHRSNDGIVRSDGDDDDDAERQREVHDFNARRDSSVEIGERPLHQARSDDDDAAFALSVSPYTFKPRAPTAAARMFGTGSLSPTQTTAAPPRSSARYDAARTRGSGAEAPPAFAFPRVADPFAAFDGFSRQPMRAALSVNPLRDRDGASFGYSSPTVGSVVAAQAQERREVAQAATAGMTLGAESRRPEVTPTAWVRSGASLAEQQRQALKERVMRDAHAAAAAASPSPERHEHDDLDDAERSVVNDFHLRQLQQQQHPASAEQVVAMRKAGAERLRDGLDNPLSPSSSSSSPARAWSAQQQVLLRRPTEDSAARLREADRSWAQRQQHLVDLPIVAVAAASPVPRSRGDDSDAFFVPSMATLSSSSASRPPLPPRTLPAVSSPTYPGAAASVAVASVSHARLVSATGGDVVAAPQIYDDDEAELERCDPDQVAIWTSASSVSSPAGAPTQQQQHQRQIAPPPPAGVPTRPPYHNSYLDAEPPIVARQLQTLPRPSMTWKQSAAARANATAAAAVPVSPHVQPNKRVTDVPLFDTFDEVPEEMRLQSAESRADEGASAAPKGASPHSVHNDGSGGLTLAIPPPPPPVQTGDDDDDDDEEARHRSVEDQLARLMPILLQEALHDDDDEDVDGRDGGLQAALTAAPSLDDAAASSSFALGAAMVAVAALPVAAVLTGSQIASKFAQPVAPRKAVTFDLNDEPSAEAASDSQSPHSNNESRPALPADFLFTSPAKEFASGSGAPYAREPTFSPAAPSPQQESSGGGSGGAPYAREPTASPQLPRGTVDAALPSPQQQQQRAEHFSPDAVPPAPVSPAAAAVASPTASASPPPALQEFPPAIPDEKPDAAAEPDQQPSPAQLPPAPEVPEEEAAAFDVIEPDAASLTLRECKHSAIITEKLHRLRADPSYIRPCKQRIVALWRDYVVLYADDADMDSTPCEAPLRLITAVDPATPPPSPSASMNSGNSNSVAGAAAAAAAAAAPPPPSQQQEFVALEILNRDDPETHKKVPSSVKWPLALGSWSQMAMQHQRHLRHQQLAKQKQVSAASSPTAVETPRSAKKAGGGSGGGGDNEDAPNMAPHRVPVVLSFASRAHREQWHEALLAIQNRAVKRQRALARQREMQRTQRQMMTAAMQQQQQQQQQQRGGAGGNGGSPAPVTAPQAASSSNNNAVIAGLSASDLTSLASLISSSLSRMQQPQQQQQQQAPQASASATPAGGKSEPGSVAPSALPSPAASQVKFRTASTFSAPPPGTTGGGAEGEAPSLSSTLTPENAATFADTAVDVAASAELLTSDQRQLAKGIVNLWRMQGAGKLLPKAGSPAGGGGGGGAGAAAASSPVASASSALGDAAGLTPEQMQAAKAVLRMWKR